jgi:hypothetical protein
MWKQLEVPPTGWQSSDTVALCANISCSTNQQISCFNVGTFSGKQCMRWEDKDDSSVGGKNLPFLRLKILQTL